MLTTRPPPRPTALVLNTNKQHLWRFLSKEFLRRDFQKWERRTVTHQSDTEDPSLCTRQLFKSGAEMLIILNLWNCFQEKNFNPSYRCGNEHQAEILKTLGEKLESVSRRKEMLLPSNKKTFFMSNWNKNLSFFATNHLSYFSIRHRCISNKKLNAYLTSWLTVN